MPRKITDEEFKEMLAEANPKIRPQEAYQGMKMQIGFFCDDCEQGFRIEPRRLLEIPICPQCGDRRQKVREVTAERNRAQAKTHDEYEAEVASANPGITLTGTYAGCDSKISCLCPRGHELAVRASSLVKPGFECQLCSREDGWALKDAAFRAAISEANSKITPLEPFRGSSKTLKFRCGDCNGVFPAEPRLLFREAVCPLCGERRKGGPAPLGHDEFVARVAAVNPHVTVIGHYITEGVKVACMCEEGHVWDAEPRNLLRGEGCRLCTPVQTSFAEQYLLASLRRSLGVDEVVSRDTVAIGMELDIYVPSRAFAVEYGSWYYHRGKVERDAEKRALAAEAGIDLLTIYADYRLQEPVFETNCMCYAEDLGSLPNRALLVDLANQLVERIGGRALAGEEHAEIAQEAYAASRRYQRVAVA